MSKSRTLTRKIERAEAALNALELKKKGLPIRAIAETIGCSKSTTHRLIQAGLRDAAKAREALATVVLDLELERLDAAHAAIWNDVEDGNLYAIDRILKISDRRCRLLGIDSPDKLALTNPAGTEAYEPVDLTLLSDADLVARFNALTGNTQN